MDLNTAMEVAKSGQHIREDLLMKDGWTVRWDVKEKLFYYFNPANERAHKIVFNDAHRASPLWKVIV